MVLKIPDSYYWAKAVESLYRYCQTCDATHVLLMNHDCYPLAGCVSRLIETVLSSERTVCHATLVHRDSQTTVWWAGNRIIRGRRLVCDYQGTDIQRLPAGVICTSSAMGQCLLMPLAAANTSFLHSKYLPHYFSDSVQTTCMRKCGYSILVRTDAVAMTDPV